MCKECIQSLSKFYSPLKAEPPILKDLLIMQICLHFRCEIPHFTKHHIQHCIFTLNGHSELHTDRDLLGRLGKVTQCKS